MSAPGSFRLSSPPSFSKDDSHTVLRRMPRNGSLRDSLPVSSAIPFSPAAISPLSAGLLIRRNLYLSFMVSSFLMIVNATMFSTREISVTYSSLPSGHTRPVMTSSVSSSLDSSENSLNSSLRDNSLIHDSKNLIQDQDMHSPVVIHLRKLKPFRMFISAPRAS